MSSHYYDTNAKRLSFLGHMSIGVRSLAASEAFYTAVLAPLGVGVVYRGGKTLGYGWGEREPLNVFERAEDAGPPGAGCPSSPGRRGTGPPWRARPGRPSPRASP